MSTRFFVLAAAGLLSLVIAAPQAAWAASAVGPGDYATQEGWGQLSIAAGRDGARRFSIVTDNLDSGCEIQGQMPKGSDNIGQASASGEAGGDVCSVEFKAAPNGVAVKAITPAACKQFCGYNGGFEGDYLRLSPACTQDAIAKTRRDFKRQYDARDYRKALATLKPVLDNCANVLDPFGKLGEIRNDVAITQYHNGLKAACLKTLSPYAEDARFSDDELVNARTLVRGLADRYLPVIRAARANIRLCSQ
jgi:hypothetical protein